MAPPISNEVLNRETDARFWAGTGYRPGQPLDPKNPTDKAMIPVWKDIFQKVQAEARAGTLVTTYDHPTVAQALSDAGVAGRAAAVHAAAAAQAPDPALAQEHVVAATTATQVSAQKAREAAAAQPPSVNPEIVQKAGQTAAQTPPPAGAAPAEHLAHVHARDHAHTHARRIHAEAAAAGRGSTPSREALYKETNRRFWDQTHYKPGQNLDMSLEQDRKMSQVWLDILHQVQREAEAGGVAATPAPPAAALPPVVAPPRAAMPSPPRPPMGPPLPGRPPMGPPMVPRPPMGPWMGPPRGFPMPGRLPMGPAPMGPMGPMGPMPGGAPSAPPMAPSPGAPSTPPMAPSAPPAGPPTTPPGAPAPSAPSGGPSDLPSGPPGEPSPGAPGEAPSSPPTEEAGVGKYIVIGLAVILGGGAVYYATTRKPEGRPRSRRPSTPPWAPRRSGGSAAIARAMPAQGSPELELEE